MGRRESYLEERRRAWQEEQEWRERYRQRQQAHIERYNRERMDRDRNRERRSRNRTPRTRSNSRHRANSAEVFRERVLRALGNDIPNPDTPRQRGGTTSQTRTGDRRSRETSRRRRQNEQSSSRDQRDSLPSTSRYPVDRSSRHHSPVHRPPEIRDRTPVRQPPRTRSQSRSSVRSRDRRNDSRQDHSRCRWCKQHHSGGRPNDPCPEQPEPRSPPAEQRTRPPTEPWRYSETIRRPPTRRPPPRRPPPRGPPRQGPPHGGPPVIHMGWPGGPAPYPNFPRQNLPPLPIMYPDGSILYPPRLQPPPPYGAPFPPHGPGPHYPRNY